MSMPGTTPGPGWTVTGQAEGVDRGPDGQLVKGVTIYARTGNGQDFSVFLPAALYAQPDKVRAALAEKAALVEQVAGMSSGASS